MDREPTEDEKEFLEEAHRLRGWISNSYSRVEFLLGDLIVRCRVFEAYNQFAGPVPHGAEKRVKRVKSILKTHGPLSQFADPLKKIIDDFEAMNHTRNLLAHGFCTCLSAKNGDKALQFQKWHREEGGKEVRLVRLLRLEELAKEEEIFVDLAQRTLGLFQSVHSHFGWGN